MAGTLGLIEAFQGLSFLESQIQILAQAPGRNDFQHLARSLFVHVAKLLHKLVHLAISAHGTAG